MIDEYLQDRRYGLEPVTNAIEQIVEGLRILRVVKLLPKVAQLVRVVAARAQACIQAREELKQSTKRLNNDMQKVGFVNVPCRCTDPWL